MFFVSDQLVKLNETVHNLNLTGKFYYNCSKKKFFFKLRAKQFALLL